MRAIDLCAGAGGLSLGLQGAGFDVLGVELDADACATHRANVGPCVEASIVGYHPPEGERFALVAGGVPCQGYSLAGKRQGSDFWREWLRIGVEAQADAMMLENVEGILSWRYEDGWGVVARIEEALRAAGYEPTKRVLCCADYGVPQLRYRLILVAFRNPRALAAWRWTEPAPERGARAPSRRGGPPGEAEHDGRRRSAPPRRGSPRSATERRRAPFPGAPRDPPGLSARVHLPRGDGREPRQASRQRGAARSRRGCRAEHRGGAPRYRCPRRRPISRLIFTASAWPSRVPLLPAAT